MNRRRVSHQTRGCPVALDAPLPGDLDESRFVAPRFRQVCLRIDGALRAEPCDLAVQVELEVLELHEAHVERGGQGELLAGCPGFRSCLRAIACHATA